MLPGPTFFIFCSHLIDVRAPFCIALYSTAVKTRHHYLTTGIPHCGLSFTRSVNGCERLVWIAWFLQSL